MCNIGRNESAWKHGISNIWLGYLKRNLLNRNKPMNGGLVYYRLSDYRSGQALRVAHVQPSSVLTWKQAVRKAGMNVNQPKG